jgi:ParB-like chromosome segregation protein Spo0J
MPIEEYRNPLGHPVVASIALAAIRRETRPWHVRAMPMDEDVHRLSQAIRASGRVVPIAVVEVAPGEYDYVTGLLRILAVESIGHTHIPASTLYAADEMTLLLMALAEQEAHVPPTLLERGWALRRLLRMREEAGAPMTQAQLADEIGMDKGDLSTVLSAARAIPRDRTEDLARRHGISPQDVARLPRKVLRLVGRALPDRQEHLLAAACEALATGEPPTRAVLRAAAAGRAGPAAPASGWRSALRRFIARVWAAMREALLRSRSRQRLA